MYFVVNIELYDFGSGNDAMGASAELLKSTLF
jgi:hypothetical protein